MDIFLQELKNWGFEGYGKILSTLTNYEWQVLKIKYMMDLTLSTYSCFFFFICKCNII